MPPVTLATTNTKNIIDSSPKMAKIAAPIVIITSMLFLLPLQAAIAQFATGNPPTTTTPPYSTMPPSSYPYIQPPQQQPLMPSFPNSPSPNSPSSPQQQPLMPSFPNSPYTPSNPSQTPQQVLPPGSSSLPPLSSTNNTVTNTSSMLNSATPQVPSLTVIIRFNNTGQGSTFSPSTPNGTNNNNNVTASFPQVVTNAYANPDGYTVVYHFFRGSQSGVVLNLQPGIYSVTDQNNNSTSNNSIVNKTLLSTTSSSLLPKQSSPALSTFTHTYSGDCNNVRSISGDIVGYGQINMGESKTCIITYNSNKNNNNNNSGA